MNIVFKSDWYLDWPSCDSGPPSHAEVVSLYVDGVCEMDFYDLTSAKAFALDLLDERRGSLKDLTIKYELMECPDGR